MTILLEIYRIVPKYKADLRNYLKSGRVSLYFFSSACSYIQYIGGLPQQIERGGSARPN